MYILHVDRIVTIGRNGQIVPRVRERILHLKLASGVRRTLYEVIVVGELNHVWKSGLPQQTRESARFWRQFTVAIGESELENERSTRGRGHVLVCFKTGLYGRVMGLIGIEDERVVYLPQVYGRREIERAVGA